MAQRLRILRDLRIVNENSPSQEFRQQEPSNQNSESQSQHGISDLYIS